MALRFLSLAEVLDLHHRVITAAGGAAGLRDLGGLESAVAQPRATYGGSDLYPTLVEKAAALGFSLITCASQCARSPRPVLIPQLMRRCSSG